MSRKTRAKVQSFGEAPHTEVTPTTQWKKKQQEKTTTTKQVLVAPFWNSAMGELGTGQED